MSACERYEADLSALLDGELEPAREEELRAHMETCDECRQLYETFSLLHEDAQEPPADLAARIMDAVRSEAPDNITPMPKKKNRWVPWLAAAACFVVIVGALAIPRLAAQKAPNAANAASRAVPMSVPESDEQRTGGSNDAALQSGNAPAQTDDVVGVTSPLTITDPEQIEAVRAMLTSPDEAEMPGAENLPILMLSDTETGSWTQVWIDGDDVVYTDNGSQFYSCDDAADALIDYLQQQ